MLCSFPGNSLASKEKFSNSSTECSYHISRHNACPRLCLRRNNGHAKITVIEVDWGTPAICGASSPELKLGSKGGCSCGVIHQESWPPSKYCAPVYVAVKNRQ